MSEKTSEKTETAIIVTMDEAELFLVLLMNKAKQIQQRLRQARDAQDSGDNSHGTTQTK